MFQHSKLTVHTAGPVHFALKIRVPAWSAPLRTTGVVGRAGWTVLADRNWHDGDHVYFEFNLQGRAIPGEFTDFARTALTWGPFVLAVDQARNPGIDSLQALRVTGNAPITLDRSGTDLVFDSVARGAWDDHPRVIKLVPFADAGAAGRAYRVWLRSF